MKRMGIVLASGLLLLAVSAVRAEGENGVPGTLHLSPVPAPAPSGCAAASCCSAKPSCCVAKPSCCAASTCSKGCDGHAGRLWDWLCYKPARMHCACSCHVSDCWPPLHTWFLDMCQGCGNGSCGHAAPCAGGACAHPAGPACAH
jgi:hypothetical protein